MSIKKAKEAYKEIEGKEAPEKLVDLAKDFKPGVFLPHFKSKDGDAVKAFAKVIRQAHRKKAEK